MNLQRRAAASLVHGHVIHWFRLKPARAAGEERFIAPPTVLAVAQAARIAPKGERK